MRVQPPLDVNKMTLLWLLTPIKREARLHGKMAPGTSVGFLGIGRSD